MPSVQFGKVTIPYVRFRHRAGDYCDQHVDYFAFEYEGKAKQADSLRRRLIYLGDQGFPLFFDGREPITAFQYSNDGVFGDASERDLNASLCFTFKTLSRHRAEEIHRERLAEFSKLLDDEDASEEEIHQFLLKNSFILYHWFPAKGCLDSGTVYSKIPLGNEYATDFVGHWENTTGDNYIFIEIEKPSDRLFGKRGDPSAKLIHAIRQVTDWSAWVADNKSYSEYLMPGIRNPSSVVFLGRAGRLSTSDRRRLSELNESLHHRPFITTFDSLLRSNRSYGYGVEFNIYDLHELRKLRPSRRGIGFRQFQDQQQRDNLL